MKRTVNAAVGALYHTWLETWLVICLFWDCVVHCIPSLKLETGVSDSWTLAESEGNVSVVLVLVLKAVRES